MAGGNQQTSVAAPLGLLHLLESFDDDQFFRFVSARGNDQRLGPVETEAHADVVCYLVVDSGFSAVEFQISRHDDSFVRETQLADPRRVLVRLHQGYREIVKNATNEWKNQFVAVK